VLRAVATEVTARKVIVEVSLLAGDVETVHARLGAAPIPASMARGSRID
jgi:hypothetical protein